jgi:hypothetical protein
MSLVRSSCHLQARRGSSNEGAARAVTVRWDLDPALLLVIVIKHYGILKNLVHNHIAVTSLGLGPFHE